MTPDIIDAGTGKKVGETPALPTSRSDREVALLKPIAHLAPGMAADLPAAAIYWTEGARKAAVMGAFARIMAGFALRALKQDLDVSQGARTDQSKDPRLAHGWKGFLTKHAGISEDTASNWMKLSKLAEPKIKKLGGLDPETLLNLSALDPAQVAVVQETLGKVFENTTYSQLALELGMVRKKKSATPPAEEPVVLDPEVLPEDGDWPWHGLEFWGPYCRALQASLAAPDDKALKGVVTAMDEALSLKKKLEEHLQPEALERRGLLPDPWKETLHAHLKELTKAIGPGPGRTGGRARASNHRFTRIHCNNPHSKTHTP